MQKREPLLAQRLAAISGFAVSGKLNSAFIPWRTPMYV